MQYHAQKIETIFRELKTSEKGLSNAEARERRSRYGSNRLPDQEKTSRTALVLRQLQSWFIYILVAAAILSYFFSKLLDAYVIIAIVILNALIGYLQEHRAEQALQALKTYLVPKAKAIRDDIEDIISAEELVPGDIIMLQAGDRVPADARIVYARDAITQESSLTGESFPVHKNVDILSEDTALADRSNMVWMGTMFTSGSATAVVLTTGLQTVLGTIATSLKTTKRKKTHFQRKTNFLAFELGLIAVIAAIVTFVIGYWFLHLPIIDVFIFSVASLVSSIPEGLPAVLAIVLAIGAYRMAQKKAIVRHLPIIADLSVVSVIITDKTGTLTQNTMTATTITSVEQEFEVSGSGWKPQGSFFHERQVVVPGESAILSKLLRIAALCNNASVHKEGTGYEVVGDPTEASFVVLAEKAGLTRDLVREQCGVIDQLPFSQDSMVQSVLVERPDKELYVIGSEESVLRASTHYFSMSGVKHLGSVERSQLKDKLKLLTGRAMRVVACASRKVPKDIGHISSDLVADLVFVGFIGIEDPVRPEARHALATARRAGIRVVMATGDHAETARAVAIKLGLLPEGYLGHAVYTETELKHMSHPELQKTLKTGIVFARLTPEMKMKLLESFQEQGHIVAMVGDGVNDAPALKKAQIGIAMGSIGTDVAREASDIILSDDNFATLVQAIEQGRRIFNNIRQTSFFMVTTSIAEIVTIIASLLFGYALPLTAIQILWINLITDGIPNIALATEEHHDDVLTKKPRSTRNPILSREVIPFLIINVLLMAAVTVIAFRAYLPFGVEKARTVAFGLMIFFQLFNALNMRSLEKSLLSIGFFTNSFLTGALLISFLVQIGIMIAPATQKAFALTPLTVGEFIWIIVIPMSVILCVELYKSIRRSIRRANY